MKSYFPSSLLISTTIFILWACNKNSNEKSVGHKRDSSEQTTEKLAAESLEVDTTETVYINGDSIPLDKNFLIPCKDTEVDEKKELEKFGIFPDRNSYFSPWKDQTLFFIPLSEDSSTELYNAFWEFQNSQNQALHNTYGDSISLYIKANLDLRLCTNYGFSPLDPKKKKKDLLFGSPPKKGFGYQIVGKDGELIRVPLKFDSIQANLKDQMGDGTFPVPVWRASTTSPDINKAIAGLMKDPKHDYTLVIGSKFPLCNSPVKPQPISDSLKLFILKNILPDKSMHRLFSSVDFYSAGGDDSKKRYVISFEIQNRGNFMFVVEVANGNCEVLFNVSASRRKTFEFCFSLTNSPIAEVFVIRIYETEWAFMKKNGKWIGVEFVYNDLYNTGC